MADDIYPKFKEYLGDGTIDLDTDTFKALLVRDGYTFSTAHTIVTDINDLTIEVTGANTGYDTGGLALGSVTWTGTDVMTFDAADIAWDTAAGCEFEAIGAIIYDDTVTSPVADPLVCFVDFGATKTVSGGTFTIQWNASGIIDLT